MNVTLGFIFVASQRKEWHDVHRRLLPALPEGGVSNVDIDGINALQIKAIGVVISTFETLPPITSNGSIIRYGSASRA